MDCGVDGPRQHKTLRGDMTSLEQDVWNDVVLS